MTEQPDYDMIPDVVRNIFVIFVIKLKWMSIIYVKKMVWHI